MANFDDITGWREELEMLRKSDVYTKIYGKPGAYHTGPSPKIPLSVLYDYAELLLKHDETREAVLALKEWGDRRTEDFIDTDNDPTWPHAENKLLTDFASWFTLKTSYGPNAEAYRRYGRYLAARTATGEFSSVRCKEGYDHIAQKDNFRGKSFPIDLTK